MISKPFSVPLRPDIFSSGSQSSGLSLEDIYREVSSLEEREMEHLKADVSAKFSRAMDTFKDCPAQGRRTGVSASFFLYMRTVL